MRFLHLQSSFHAGGKELRTAQLINAFGPGIAHSIVSAQPDALGAARAIAAGMDVTYPADFPSLSGKPFPARLRKLAQAMVGHDLVLTYNWGAMDAVLAHAMFCKVMDLPPLIHHEDGFNEDEAAKLKTSRNLYRRLALARAFALVVPSQRLEGIALGVWKQPRALVHRIANGIDTAAFTRKVPPDALPRLIKRPDELWLGTLAGLRPVKNLVALVRAFAAMPEPWHLVIAGEGPERDAIAAEALALGQAHRVHLPGFVSDPAKAVGLFDIFALSSRSEQFPISVVEAMAAGIPVVSPAVGDVAGMVSAENARFITPPGDEAALSAALVALAQAPDLRADLGGANRDRAQREYDSARMLAAYRALYGAAVRRPLPG